MFFVVVGLSLVYLLLSLERIGYLMWRCCGFSLRTVSRTEQSCIASLFRAMLLSYVGGKRAPAQQSDVSPDPCTDMGGARAKAVAVHAWK